MNPAEKSFVERWSDIINSVEKTTIPAEYVKRVTINIDNENNTTIDVDRLKKNGVTPDMIDMIFHDTLELHGVNVADTDFYVDVAAVGRMIQKETNKLLNLN